MNTKFTINWTQVIEAFRYGGTLMLMQGVLLGLLVEAPQWVAWAKGSILLGLLFWAGASFAKQQDI